MTSLYLNYIHEDPTSKGHLHRYRELELQHLWAGHNSTHNTSFQYQKPEVKSNIYETGGEGVQDQTL